MMRRILPIFAVIVSLLSGCIIIFGGGNSSEDLYYPSINNASWECYNLGYVDEWEFWIETNFYDVSYILVEVIDLVEGNNLHISFLDYDTIYGYYYHIEQFSTPRCGIPVDVEFTVYDYDGYWEKYTVYW